MRAAWKETETQAGGPPVGKAPLCTDEQARGAASQGTKAADGEDRTRLFGQDQRPGLAAGIPCFLLPCRVGC